MMISTRGRYALRVMLDMAEHGGGEWLCLRGIAQRQQLSKKYLESIMAALSRAELVEGTVGRSGGYRLTRPPEEYPVGETLRAVEGALSPIACQSEEVRQRLRLRLPAFLAGAGGSDQFLHRQPYAGTVYARKRNNTGQCGAERILGDVI